MLIADDSISTKSGKNIELVSYHFDHKVGRSILGNCYLQLGYHNGINFYPVDVALINSSNRSNARLRDIDKRTCGWKRRKEALNKKTTALLQMVERAWHAGIDASFLLFDSWFAHDKIISSICDTRYGVICRLKRGLVKYGYQGQRFGFEIKFNEAPKITKSMRMALNDLCLDHLWVVYPGTEKYPVDTKITVIPLSKINEIQVQK